MNKKLIVLISILGIAVVFAGVYFAQRNNIVVNTQSANSGEQSEVENTVKQFGKKLQMVSLLAPAATVKQSIKNNYESYVAPELLSVWQNTPTQAPGKTTSSPWPDRIEISTIAKNTDGTYRVQGNVIEMTSQEQVRGGVAAYYPVDIQVAKFDGKWLITKFEKGPYANLSQETTLVGVYTCLPHRNTDGPQTLECALGIKADNGSYYALDTNMLKDPLYSIIKTGDRISVKGILVPIEEINSNTWQKYNIKGIMRVASVNKI